jgi:hypothetical protein
MAEPEILNLRLGWRRVGQRQAGDVVESGLVARELAQGGVDARDPLGGACAVAWREEI